MGGHTLTAGSITMSAGGGSSFDIFGPAGSTLNVGTLTISGSAFLDSIVVNVSGSITNNGVLDLFGSTINGSLINNGTVTNGFGGIEGTADFTNQGIFTITSPVSGATYTQTAGTTSILSAPPVEEFPFGSLTLTGQLAVNGGTFDVNGPVVAGSISNAGTFTVRAAVSGTGTGSESGSLIAGSVVTPGNFTNTGTLVIETGGTVSVGSTFANSGTTNVSGSLAAAAYSQSAGSTQNFGTMTITGLLSINGGTFTNNSTITAGSYVQNGGSTTNSGLLSLTGPLTINGGTFTNNSAISAASYLQTGGSVTNFGTLSLTGAFAINGGTFTGNSPLTATSMSNAGTFEIASSVSTPGVFSNAGTVNVAPNGTLTAGSLANALGGIVNNAGRITDDLTNAGTVNNASVYNAIVASNSGIINNNAGAIWNGSIQSNTGTINTLGTWNAQGPINNAGTFNYFGGNVVGVTTFANSGTLNFSGSQIIANSPGSFVGPASVSFANNGIIAARAPTDTLTINGTLSGSGTINTVVGNGNASVVTVQGVASGSQNITVTNAGSSSPVFTSPQTVLALNGGGSLTVGNKGIVPQISNGLVNNFLMQNGAGSNAFLQTAFNDGPVSGIATGLSSAISVLATGFFPNISAIVSRPDNPAPNQIGGGPFARVLFGGSKTNLTSSANGFGQSTTSSTNGTTNYSGLQAGFDVGVYNIEGSGWNVNLGLFGGVANAGTSATTDSPTPAGANLTSTTQLSLSVPFVALYTVVSKESFTAEVNVRQDFYNGSILSFTNATNGFLIAPNTPLSGTGWSLNANVANRFNIKEWLYVEPLVSMNWGNYTFNSVNFNSALGLGGSSINPGTIEILLGRAGVNVGSNFLATDNLVLAPFINGSIWHDFAGQNSAVAQTSGGNFSITADRIGTFGQIGGGVQFKFLDMGVLGFARGDFLFGDNITGASFNIGLKKQF